MRWSELFSAENRSRTEESRRTYARYELTRTAIQFAASLCFLAGSALSLLSDPGDAFSWLFLVGSVLFAAAPTLRLWSELTVYRMGRTDTLASRSEQLAPDQFEDYRRKREGDE